MTGSLAPSPQQIGAHFNVVSAIPATMLVAFTALLVASGAPADPPDLGRVSESIARLRVIDIGLLLFTTIALGLLLHPFQVGFVKLLEGYGDETGALTPLRRWGVRRFELLYDHLEALSAPPGADEERDEPDRARIDALSEEADARLARLPVKDRLLPTLLGNTLRQAEDHAGRRYGLDAIEVIPRLFPLMPPSMAEIIDDARTEMDVMASLVLVWLVATLISVLALFQHGPWLLVAVATYGLAWLAYRGCVASARAYGETLVWAMDLYRFNLYEQMRIEPPCSHEAELRDAERLTDFLKGDWAHEEPLAPHWGPTYQHPQPLTVSVSGTAHRSPPGERGADRSG